MSERISAEAFAEKTSEQRDWMIYDSLGKGQETMTGLRTDVDMNTHTIKDMGSTLNTHISDTEAHHKVPDNPGTKSRIREKKWQAFILILGIVTVIVTYHFGGG